MRKSSDARLVSYFLYYLSSRSDTYDPFETEIAPSVLQPVVRPVSKGRIFMTETAYRSGNRRLVLRRQIFAQVVRSYDDHPIQCNRSLTWSTLGFLELFGFRDRGSHGTCL